MQGVVIKNNFCDKDSKLGDISVYNRSFKKLLVNKIKKTKNNNSVFFGTRWNAVNQAATSVIRLIVSIIVARILNPEDFGLLAMAYIFIGFLNIFKDLGTVDAIIQKKNITHNLLNSVFTFNVIIGLSFWIFIIAASPIISRFFGEESLVGILSLMGVTFFIHSFGSVQRALMQKNMRFRTLAIIEISAVSFNSILAIILALAGLRVWALVWGFVFGTIFSTIMIWYKSSWRPKLYFKWKNIQSIFYFSLNLTGSNIFGYFIISSDSLLIGRFLGSSPLGFYNLTQRILMNPVRLITQSVTRALFPALAKIKDDNYQLKDKYLRACGGIAIISFPLLTGATILAEPFVLTLFGEKWRPIILLIKILSPIAIIQSITTTVGVIYLVKGKTNLLLYWQIGSGITTLISVVLGLSWGLIGVAISYGIAVVLLTYPAFYIPFKLIELRVLALLKELYPYFVATLIMSFVVFTLKLLLSQQNYQNFVILIACTIIGVLTYVVTVLFLQPRGLNDLFNTFSIPKKLIVANKDGC